MRVRAALCVALLVLTVARGAQAVCTAAEIIAHEPSCARADSTCSINGDYSVEDGCSLDFGARQVRLVGHLTVGSRTATVNAGSFSVDPNGFLDARGGAADAPGGMVTIVTSGGFVAFENSRIDASGSKIGGNIIVRAGGDVVVAGKVQADFLTIGAGGGLIDISTPGAISVTNAGLLSAEGGSDSDGGGEIDLTAGGRIDVASDLLVGGLDGGFIEIAAGSNVTMRGADASGGGDAGSGGCIDIVAGLGLQVLGDIVSNGASGTFMSGGCGGLICLEAQYGDLTIAAGGQVSADGASPDGGGGQLTLVSKGSTSIVGGIEARGPTGETCGGDICIDSTQDLTVGASMGATVDVSGGDSGGDIEFIVGRNATINGLLDASGRQTGALGGDVVIRTGQRGTGSLSLATNVDVTSRPSCSDLDGCGEAGVADLSGCDVTFSNGASILASGPDGGNIILTARNLLTMPGMLDATRTVPTGKVGTTQFVFAAAHPPMVTGTVNPAPTSNPLTTCPLVGQTTPPCLTPCPVCGDNIVEFPETCDLGFQPPFSCLGCSIFCQSEDCTDNLTCTTNSCSPTLGCRIQRVPPPCTEPPTPTATVTGTPPTATATGTQTPTATATPTPTATASSTPTITGTDTPTPPPTSTTTPSLTATAIPTASVTATSSTTATPPDTATPAATATSVVVCAGDCSHNGTVTVNELIVGVNIALGSAATSACPAFDSNGNGSVSINELIAAVNALLNGC